MVYGKKNISFWLNSKHGGDWGGAERKGEEKQHSPKSKDFYKNIKDLYIYIYIRLYIKHSLNLSQLRGMRRVAAVNKQREEAK